MKPKTKSITETIRNAKDIIERASEVMTELNDALAKNKQIKESNEKK